MNDPQTIKVQQRIKRLMRQKKIAKQNYKLQNPISQIQIRKRAASQTTLQQNNYNNLLSNKQSSKTYSKRLSSKQQNDQQQQLGQKSVRTTQWKKSIKNNNNFYDKNYHRQTQNSDTTATNQPSQSKKINAQKIVQNVFLFSPKLAHHFQKQLVSGAGIKKQQAMRELLNNELFMLNITNKLTKISTVTNSNQLNTVFNQIIENQVILKLNKLQRRKKQSLLCYDVENRIKSLINHRLDSLKKY